MARYDNDLDIGESLLRGWLAGQQLGQRRREFNDEIAFQREREQRYVEQMEWQRRQAEAVQAEELKRRAADQSIMQGLFPQPQQQQFQDPGVQGMMGTMQGAGMLPQPQQQPDLRQLLSQYGAMASPQVMRAATETLQAKQQSAAEESRKQFEMQRIAGLLSDIDREINARETAARKAGNNPNDPLVAQVHQQLDGLYRRRSAMTAAMDSVQTGIPGGTLAASYDNGIGQRQQAEQPSITQQLAMVNAQIEAQAAPLEQERRFMQEQVKAAAQATGSADPVALSGQRFMLADGRAVSFADFALRMQQIEQGLSQVMQAKQQMLGGMGGNFPPSPQVPVVQPPQTQIGAPPPTVAPQQLPDLVSVMAQIKAENPGITREAAIQLAKQRLGAN